MNQQSNQTSDRKPATPGKGVKTMQAPPVSSPNHSSGLNFGATPASASAASPGPVTAAAQPFQIRPARPRLIPASVEAATSIDTTGSTEPFALAVPKVFGRVGRGLAEKISDIKYDVWSHGDLDCGQNPIQHCSRADLDRALAAIESLTYSGGGDPPEHHASQVENLLAVTPWGADPLKSRNILLMFATDDTKPLRSGKSMKQLGKEVKDKGVFLFLVCQDTPNLRELVDSAGGFLIPISTAPNEEEIRKVVSRLTASIAATVTRAPTIAANPANA